MSESICSYLILFNIAKQINFGNLIRTANAFGSQPVCVGKKDFSRCGATAGTRLTKVRHFYTLHEACRFVRSRGCRIYGVEIHPAAASVVDHPFTGSTAFMMGNEGEGLTEKQLRMCDCVVYIPQHGSAVSLNVNVAAGIVLHHFATWARFQQTTMCDNKFMHDSMVKRVVSLDKSSPDGQLDRI